MTRYEVFVWVMFLIFCIAFVFVMSQLMVVGHFVDQHGLNALVKLLWDGPQK